MPFRQLAYLPDRRSMRTDQAVHLIIRGMDVSRVPYQEKVSTLSISCHGCRYLSRNKVLLGDIATLEVVHRRAGGPKFPAQVRVRSVKQLAASEMLFDVAAELEFPGNIWGIASPPEDWAEFSKIEAFGDSTRDLQIVPRPQIPKALERIPAETIRHSHLLEPYSASALPPFLAQLIANLREEIRATTVVTHEAEIAKNTGGSLDEFCSQLERKAMKAFEGLVKDFVEGSTNRLRQMSQTPDTSALGTYERWTADRSKR